MLQRPRKIQHACFFNIKRRKNLVLQNTNQNTLILVRPLNIKWLHFETLRIKIARILAKQRRGGKKTLFKQKIHKKTRRATGQRTLKQVQKIAIIKFYGFPGVPFTYKTQGSRMGKGKGGTVK